MNADEFMQRYSDEPYELVVRILWCWNKSRGPFPCEGGLCHARARFDRAIDTRSDEVIGQGRFMWLEWLTPKRLLGHPYGYAFEEGHLYRVLVREEREQGDDRNRSYYVDRLVEADVREPRLDPLLEFESAYHSEVVERCLLIEGDPFGWSNCFGYRRAGVRYIAMALEDHDQPRAVVGQLSWMEKARGERLKTRFDTLGVYRVRVREGREDPRRLLLVKVVRKLHDERFDAIVQEYQRAIELRTSLGSFVLNRRYDWYEGTIDYLGKESDVLLEVEEGSTDARVALGRLESLCTDLSAVDRAAREFAADEMLENACDWCEEELTREQFVGRMGTPSLTIGPDGSVGFMFDDGGMFCGHVIVVDMEADGSFSRADIEG